MLGAIAPWFGGKRTIAPAVVDALGDHKAYYEPICGSCAVLIRKPVVAIELVNDLHACLVTLAMVLASDRWEDLYLAVDRILRILMCQELLDSFVHDFNDEDVPAAPSSVTDDHVRQAARYLAVSWIFRNGCAGTRWTNYQMAVRWTQKGGSPGVRWRAAVDSVPDWHDRLKGVTITRRDAFDILSRISDQDGTAIYVDPPYLRSTRSGGGGSHYLHDFNDPDREPDSGSLFEEKPKKVNKHLQLSRLLARFERARVVVSYYDHDALDTLYPSSRWRKTLLTRTKNLSMQNARDQRGANANAPEVLFVNR